MAASPGSKARTVTNPDDAKTLGEWIGAHVRRFCEGAKNVPAGLNRHVHETVEAGLTAAGAKSGDG